MQGMNKSNIQKFVHSFCLELNSPETVTEYILEHAQGMFLWLPGDELEDLYKFPLRELDVEGKQLFKWVLLARRLLTVLELQDALAIQSSPDNSDKSFQEDLIVEIQRRIIHKECSLLEITGHEVHQSVREFFLRGGEYMSVPDVHVRIAVSCLWYLILCTAYTSTNESPASPIEFWTPTHFEAYVRYLDSRPVICYALGHLKDHMEQSLEAEDLSYLVAKLVKVSTTDNPAFHLLQHWVAARLNVTLVGGQSEPSRSFTTTILWFAASLGRERVVKRLLEAGADVETWLQGKSPLIISTEHGQREPWDCCSTTEPISRPRATMVGHR
ncbi:hypothetical protein FN846DRAFT_997745 [Sphaerosporella brunnea]|uniref:Ankyrin repeat-containing domain protein n=1 Tax=Sphaerosporella brunnea TaxID=1250544 RepID=A0A5J5EJ41_9PEZI|nr:hypothetical protein FN846DRAFT_997745 [Sphaerosporella brunnea]